MKDCRAHLVIQSAESMFIATAVGRTIDRDGRNIDSLVAYKVTNEAKRKEVLRLKKGALKLMQDNHAGLPVVRLEGTCDENRTYIEYV